MQNVRVFMCRHSSGINHSLSGSGKHFLQLPKSQFNQPLGSNSGVSCRAWMGKATRASPDPYPCVPKEDCKSFGTQTGIWPGPKNTLFLCAVDIAITPRATARALGSNQHHGGGVGDGCPLKQRTTLFFPARGEENWKKSQGKDNWGSGKCRWCQENTAWKC